MAPAWTMTLAVAAKVRALVITSSPGPMSAGEEGEVHAGGAGVDGDGVFRAGEGGEIALELLRLLAVDDPAGAQGLDDLVDLFLADVGAREVEEFFGQSWWRAGALPQTRRRAARK